MIDITPEFAKRFADEWVSAWNSHDIEQIMRHYSEDFVISSRIADNLVPGSNGTISGMKAVRAYWTTGLSRNKNLKFEVFDVLYGMAGISIYYKNLTNNLRAVEMMIFNEEGKIIKTIVHHSEMKM